MTIKNGVTIHAEYNGYNGTSIFVMEEYDSVSLVQSRSNRSIFFTPEQYTGFIQQEFIRLYQAGVIEKMPAFNNAEKGK